MTQSTLNETHNPSLKSWVQSANDGKTDFPIQNLPFASFNETTGGKGFRGGVAIGDQIVDLKAVSEAGLFDGLAKDAVDAAANEKLNTFMAMGKEAWSALRAALSGALAEGSEQQTAMEACLVAQSDVEYGNPCHIPDYTDFYASVHHATNIGALFRPDNPLLPNYKWIPIGYHGRSSSIGVSGQSFPRPKGQTKAPDAAEPSFGPCKRLDFELEMGAFVGKGNDIGESVSIEDAEDHVFGMCLFNDWSARDIQGWEYQPLGPFLAKNFASTISPWIVTMEALAPYRVAFSHPADDPQPLPYLTSDENSAKGGLDIELEVLLQTEKMRNAGEAAVSLATSNMKYSYWTIAQMMTHHTVGGCNMQAGDLMATGTMSGPDASEACAMIELTSGGKNPITLPNGETRTFLEDGDTVVVKGFCKSDQPVRIGFGECAGTVLPAK
ncbi:fumarylacetoacetase [Sneathiella sp. P13V-1]|uniref:fumarylacetoacetase n=1 Tax=Sneathiella sp. P13V-1 TaxID=2697366 RepID=UPI00187B462F|nr:fumarylacetoacetase [Sneathiella sp. P13V-1]MBE7637828.1 fumarylacetoacetase [Sneathiella sp. P13V-1]